MVNPVISIFQAYSFLTSTTQICVTQNEVAPSAPLTLERFSFRFPYLLRKNQPQKHIKASSKAVQTVLIALIKRALE